MRNPITLRCPIDKPAERALRYLETHTGFSRDVRQTIRRAAGWPRRWMTAEEVERELRLRNFWSRGREAVQPDVRAALVRLYLEQKVAEAIPGSATGWVQSGDRYLYREGTGGSTAAESGERREFVRVEAQTELLRCQYGRVVNLSLGGVRIVAAERPKLHVGERVALDMAWLDEPAMRLRARVIWINEAAEGHVVGFEFRPMASGEAVWLRETIRRAAASLVATT